MAQARQQYVADGAYVDKQKKEFTLTNEIIEKLDSIEPSAERNAIQGIKVNGELQTPDQYRVVNLTIPEVVDSLDSYDNRSSLSARQGRVLAQQIKNLQSIGKFLSNWNSTTGLPTSNPSTIPYIYKPGDYYIVSIVGSANYRPEGTSFDGSSSSTLETELVDVGDIYIYDDEGWLLLHNSARVIAVDTSLSTSSTNPVENRVITQALNTKQEKIIAGANIQIAQDGKTISATDTTYDNLPAAQGGTADSLVTTGDKYNWDNKQKALTAGANIQIAQDGTISATDTVYGAGANIQINGNIISATDTTYVAGDFDIKDLADSTGLRVEWSGKQDELIAGNNIQIAADGKTISATDTTYTAGPGISISNNNVISNTQTSAEWGNITGTLSDQTDLQSALDAKQGTLTAGANIQITGNTISATDTTYTASDFDIKDLADSTGKRASWDAKQDAISDLATIRSNATAGAGAATTIAGYGDIVTHNSSEFLTTDKISDVAYASSWNGATGVAPSKNAVYDKLSSMDAAISGKQDTISDLTTIRSNASAGKSASDTIATYGDIVTHDVDEFATAAQGSLASTAIQPNDNVSELTNDAGYITSADIPTLDTTMSDTSTNGVQNKVIKSYVDTQVSEATAGAVSDTAYGSSWNGVTGIAPSKNAVYDKISSMDTTISGHTSSISTINGKIPSAATASNQLADKNYVDDSINSVTAYYITKNATGDQWATRAELFAATTFYSGGVVRVPTKNDYTIVLSDEQHDNATTRYIYNNSWEYQYTVNETAMTQAQLNALNSGITSGKVSTYDGYASGKQDKLTAGSGIDITNTTISTASIYGTSSTAAATAEKVVSIPSITSLNVGQVIIVHPTITSTVADSTIKLNNFTAYPMRYNNAAITTSSDSIVWHANYLSMFMFDGTYWQFLGHGLDTNTTYSNMSATEANTGTATSARTISASVLKGAVETHAPVQSVNGQTGAVSLTIPTVNNATLTIQKNGTNVQTFTANQSTNATANITVNEVPSSGTTGYVLTKTSSGYGWAEPTGGISLDSNSPITVSKLWVGTEAQYSALGSYSDDTVYMTV